MDTSVLLSTGSTAVIASILLQALKNSKAISFLGDGDQHANANRIVAALLAGISSLGIHFAYDVNAGTLVVTGLHAANIGHVLWQWVTQYAVQHLFYKSSIVPVELAVKNGQLLHQLLEIQRTQHQAIMNGYNRVTQAGPGTGPKAA